VLFAHGSGSSRFSPRNRFVAKKLSDRGIGTLTVAQYLVGRPVKLTLSFEAQGRRTRRPAQTGDIVAEVETEKADIDVEIFVEAGEARSPDTAARRRTRADVGRGYRHTSRHGTGRRDYARGRRASCRIEAFREAGAKPEYVES
jgi:hypothetical protein